jgi:transcriptional regulator with XRE-family HTH domain
MYTNGALTKRQTVEIAMPASKTLGRFLRDWRMQQGLTVEAAADRVGIVKSTWSNLERDKRRASLETLLRLSEQTGLAIEELARMQDPRTRASVSTEDRARRVAAVAHAIPQIDAFLDLLGELSPGEIDVLLSAAETMIYQHRQR